ncbi:MAG: hypothetical protein ACI4DV_04000 [Lachnospiraceae bacterium]
MSKVITFLCVNPKDSFFAPQFPYFGKRQYEKLVHAARYLPFQVNSSEHCWLYGETSAEVILRDHPEPDYQFCYVESGEYGVISSVFEQSDLVVIALPGNRTEFERVFSVVFRWKDKLLFLWNRYMTAFSALPVRLARECQMSEKQFLEIQDLRNECREELSYRSVVQQIYRMTGSESYGRKFVRGTMA